MEISLQDIQKNYSEFQDTISEIDHYYDITDNKFENILEYCTNLYQVFEGVGSENINDESASSSNAINQQQQQQQQPELKKQQLIIGIKEPIEIINTNIELINNKLNKLNNLLESSKNLVENLTNINDLNLISNRGKNKLELSISDLIEFMTITFNNYEQDYQMKQILLDDIKIYRNGDISNLTIDKLNNTVPMWQSKPLLDKTSLQYITQRVQLFNLIVRLSK